MTTSGPPAQGQEHLPLVPVEAPPLSPVQRLRRIVFGSPISTEHAEHTLLRKILALPVFASDAISSVAYATQQIVLALGAAGLFALEFRAQYTSAYISFILDFAHSCSPMEVRLPDAASLCDERLEKSLSISTLPNLSARPVQ